MTNLASLFNYSVENYNKEQKEISYFPQELPICQHNIYKYSPFRVVKLSENEYSITFPEHFKNIITNLVEGKQFNFISSIELIFDIPSSLFLPYLNYNNPKFSSFLRSLNDKNEKLCRLIDSLKDNNSEEHKKEIFAQYLSFIPEYDDENENFLQLLSFLPLIENTNQNFQILYKEKEGEKIEDLISQIYLSYVNSFNFETAYNQLSDVSIFCDNTQKNEPVFTPSQLIEISDNEVKRIVQLHDDTNRGRDLSFSINEIKRFSTLFEERLKNIKVDSENGFFFKLNSRSAKDSWYYKQNKLMESILSKNKDKSVTKNRSLQACKAFTAYDVISAMVGSSRVSEDCRSYLQWKCANKPPVQLVIQDWISFPSEYEFRCFIFNGRVTAINQLCWSEYIPHIEQNSSLQMKIVQSVVDIQKKVHPLLPWNNYIMDVIFDIKNECSQICEFNPWGPYSCTGSQLYNWELDSPILFGLNSSSVDLRLLRPFMKVEGQFELYVDRDLYSISSSLQYQLQNIVPRCPCCSFLFSS